MELHACYFKDLGAFSTDQRRASATAGKLEPGRLVSAIGLLIPQCRPGRTTKTPRLQGNLSRRSRSYGHSMGVNTPARKSALALGRPTSRRCREQARVRQRLPAGPARRAGAGARTADATGSHLVGDARRTVPATAGPSPGRRDVPGRRRRPRQSRRSGGCRSSATLCSPVNDVGMYRKHCIERQLRCAATRRSPAQGRGCDQAAPRARAATCPRSYQKPLPSTTSPATAAVTRTTRTEARPWALQ